MIELIYILSGPLLAIQSSERVDIQHQALFGLQSDPCHLLLHQKLSPIHSFGQLKSAEQQKESQYLLAAHRTPSINISTLSRRAKETN